MRWGVGVEAGEGQAAGGRAGTGSPDPWGPAWPCSLAHWDHGWKELWSAGEKLELARCMSGVLRAPCRHTSLPWACAVHRGHVPLCQVRRHPGLSSHPRIYFPAPASGHGLSKSSSSAPGHQEPAEALGAQLPSTCQFKVLLHGVLPHPAVSQTDPKAPKHQPSSNNSP